MPLPMPLPPKLCICGRPIEQSREPDQFGDFLYHVCGLLGAAMLSAVAVVVAIAAYVGAHKLLSLL